jgi:hypothetical protein
MSKNFFGFVLEMNLKIFFTFLTKIFNKHKKYFYIKNEFTLSKSKEKKHSKIFHPSVQSLLDSAPPQILCI